MSSKSMMYDNPTYVTREAAAMGEVGGAATTQYAKFAAYTAALAFSLTATVTTAGTAAGHTLTVNKISGTSTTALATATLGTSAAGTVLNVPLSTSTGGVSLNQGDIISVVTGADVVGKAAVAYEWGAQPGANITA
jgi:hypothetical protein